MNPVLKKLIRVQNLADQIKSHQKRCTEVPAQIELLEKQFATAQAKADSVKTKIKDNETKIRKNEQSIADSRDQQGKYRTQLFKLKSNREYKALNKEIEMLNEKISASETAIIEAMEAIDNAGTEMKDAEMHLKEEKARIDLDKKALEHELTEENRRLKEAEDAYASEHESIPEETRVVYDRMVRKNGRGIATIEGKNCGNCYVKVQPRIAATALGNDTLINCDKCGVFLFNLESGA